MQGARVADELRKLLGTSKVSAAEQVLVTYSTDMLPLYQISKLARQLPPRRPLAVCFPESTDEVSRVVDFCRREQVPLIPFGAGSGVCGATLPEEDCIMVDLKRMNRLIEVRTDLDLAIVEPGLIGEELEELLNLRGFTAGHFPSSIACSTVGGYVACRSAGQYSSRYGKYEHMVKGLEVVLPDARVVRLGILGGGHPKDPTLALFLGSEGTLGVVTRVALRIEPLPDKVEFRGFAFLDPDDGLTCMRRVMQNDVRPTVLRLYDPLDSLIAGFHGKTTEGEDIHRAAARFSGLKGTLASAVTELNEAGIALGLLRPGVLNRVVELLPTRSLLIVGVQGDGVEVTRQWDTVRALSDSVRGEDLGTEPGLAWYRRRYAVSYKQSKIYAAGGFVDTMEVATTWENVAPLYRAVLKALSKHVFIMAHFSHAYRQGCSIYFTFAGYRPTGRGASSLYRRTWRIAMDTVLRHGGTISHHHGVGVLKRFALDKEVPGGRSFFEALKESLDPMTIMNPGKLYSVSSAEKGGERS